MSSEIFNPKDYGAVGDGSSDDTRAVLDTIDALPAAGGVIAFPSGHFMLGNLDDTSGKSYTVRGAGSGRTGIGTIPLAGVTSLTALNPGVAYIWGINQLVVDPRDPFPHGFQIEKQGKIYGFDF